MSAARRIAELARTRPIEAVVAGAAIVDVLSQVDLGLPERLGLDKGRMQLVEGSAGQRVYDAMGERQEVSGGGAANTALCLARLGARVAFEGKIADDRLGEVFAGDMRAGGVEFETARLPKGDGAGTGRSLILVTPDSDRTMCTELAASKRLGPEDLARAPIDRCAMAFVEAFLLDCPENDEAVREGFRRARRSGAAVALSLSDPACVHRNAERIREEIELGVDVLVANEQEASALTGASGLQESLERVGARIPVVAITRSGEGAVVLQDGETATVPAEPVARVRDTTGAGDSFAAGFLFGVLRGFAPAESARLGARIAGLVIQELGARPRRDLAGLLPEGANG